MKRLFSILFSIVIICVLCTNVSAADVMFSVTNVDAGDIKITVTNVDTNKSQTITLNIDNNNMAQTKLEAGEYKVSKYEVENDNYDLLLDAKTFAIKESTEVATIKIKVVPKEEKSSFIQGVLAFIKNNAIPLVLLLISYTAYLMVKRKPKKVKPEDVALAEMMAKHEEEQAIFKDDPIDLYEVINGKNENKDENAKTIKSEDESMSENKEQ